jgi:hypothetical protein
MKASILTLTEREYKVISNKKYVQVLRTRTGTKPTLSLSPIIKRTFSSIYSKDAYFPKIKLLKSASFLRRANFWAT